MKIIAFKRNKNNPHLHPEFITEFIDAQLLESTDGYETMIEEHFNLELAKNPERHEQHLAHLKQQEELARKAEQDALSAEIKLEKELDREFERFKMWRKHQGKK